MVKELISQEQIDNAPVLKPSLRLKEGMIIMKDCHMTFSVPEIREKNMSTVFESRYTPRENAKLHEILRMFDANRGCCIRYLSIARRVNKRGA